MNIKCQFNSTEKVAVKNLKNLKICLECFWFLFELLEIKYLQKFWSQELKCISQLTSQLPNQLFSETMVQNFYNRNDFPFFLKSQFDVNLWLYLM